MLLNFVTVLKRIRVDLVLGGKRCGDSSLQEKLSNNFDSRPYKKAFNISKICILRADFLIDLVSSPKL